mmetsp:Transcript_18127/g.27436  ORF Transcript_18127/g.27436 Transcript_18127/m.27436 type:complete len:102 (-) Transcript_18127:11-316(-)
MKEISFAVLAKVLRKHKNNSKDEGELFGYLGEQWENNGRTSGSYRPAERMSLLWNNPEMSTYEVGIQGRRIFEWPIKKLQMILQDMSPTESESKYGVFGRE